MILSETGDRINPIFAYFTSENFGGQVLVQALKNPKFTLNEVTNVIGKIVETLTVKDDVKIWPSKVLKNVEGKPQVNVTYRNKEEAS